MHEHAPAKYAHREYRTDDDQWRIIRTRTGPRPSLTQWEVQTRSATTWARRAAFAKRRDARLFLEDHIALTNQPDE